MAKTHASQRGFDVAGLLQAGPPGIAHPGVGRAQHHPRQRAQWKNNDALGPHGHFRHFRGVDHSHISHLAFLHQPQLLCAVEQVQVELCVDLDIARETQQVLLRWVT